MLSNVQAATGSFYQVSSSFPNPLTPLGTLDLPLRPTRIRAIQARCSFADRTPRGLNLAEHARHGDLKKKAPHSRRKRGNYPSGATAQVNLGGVQFALSLNCRSGKGDKCAGEIVYCRSRPCQVTPRRTVAQPACGATPETLPTRHRASPAAADLDPSCPRWCPCKPTRRWLSG